MRIAQRLLLWLSLLPALAYADTSRVINGEGLEDSDTAALNVNFDQIDNEFGNVVHKTSTETIHGFKYFDNATITTATITGATITTATITSIRSWDGWISPNETWTRLGASSFTVSGNVTSKYTKGCRLKYKDGGSFEYATVYGNAYTTSLTTVTIATNTDYTFGATLTDNYISYEVVPQGYPTWFNYGSTWTASGAQPAIGNGILNARFCIIGTMVTVQLYWQPQGTSTFGTGTYSWSLPTDANTTVQQAAKINIGSAYMENAPGVTAYSGWCRLGATTGAKFSILYWDNLTAGVVTSMGQTTPFSWAGDDFMGATITYEMN